MRTPDTRTTDKLQVCSARLRDTRKRLCAPTRVEEWGHSKAGRQRRRGAVRGGRARASGRTTDADHQADVEEAEADDPERRGVVRPSHPLLQGGARRTQATGGAATPVCERRTGRQPGATPTLFGSELAHETHTHGTRMMKPTGVRMGV